VTNSAESSHEESISNLSSSAVEEQKIHDKDLTIQMHSNNSCECATDMENIPKSSVGVSPFVYAIGTVDYRFPNVSIEKELAQVIGRTNTKQLTDHEAIHAVLTKSENRYLARQLCWVMKIGGLESFILIPRNSEDIEMFIESLRPSPSPTDVNVVIGYRGPIANPAMCNGLSVPVVSVDQIYSFDFDSLIKEIPRPEKVQEKQFKAAAKELLNRIIDMTDNTGATDEHRAVNYLAVRYDGVYRNIVECYQKDCSLTSIEVRPSSISAVRKLVDVIISQTNRTTGVVEKYSVRVDVTNEFPFLVTSLSPYYDR
jgi:hypothetical protein